MLKYKGGGYIAGVPAQDLTPEMIPEGFTQKQLIDSGLYEKQKSEPKKQAKEQEVEE